MAESFQFTPLTIRLRHERHVVQARQRARELAARLGFEHQEQIRLATATSELARNAFRYAVSGSVEFSLCDSTPQIFAVCVRDAGPGILNLNEILDGRYVSKTGLGMGLLGTKRLMEHFQITTTTTGTQVECGKSLPSGTPRITSSTVKAISLELANGSSADPFDEIERQNQELLKTLAALKEKQDQLADLNRELEDTNRGVVALYAELEQHADDLRKVSDLKTSFLSSLSHEFRTPLNSIASLSRLLLGRTDGTLSGEQEKQVTYIQQSAAELAELVNDLLDLAKVEAGKIDVKPKQFEVNDFFGGLRGMLKPLLAGNSLELNFDPAPEIPPLFTDEGKVSQILRNLISNALKFTRKGQIHVSAENDADGWIAFRVADTGIGIRSEDHERIFEEFVQIESEMQTQFKGTGLGLPLSRRLAGLLGGSLEVESEPGVGSVFTLKITVCFGPRAPEPLPKLVDLDGATGPVILFIEDNRETSFVHQSALKNTGFQSVFAANLPESRAAMKQLHPSLVVLDRLIDQKDCLYYIEEMRSKGYTGPVLVVSVVDDPTAALDAGATAFLVKPVLPLSLLNMIRELVQGEASKTILLVDDDEVSCYLIGGALARAGYRILEARSGREALRMVEEVPDAIILDIAMPEMNGFEVLREIRANVVLKALPVVIHSSRALSQHEQKLLFSDKRTIVYSKRTFEEEGGPEGLLRMLQSMGLGV